MNSMRSLNGMKFHKLADIVIFMGVLMLNLGCSLCRSHRAEPATANVDKFFAELIRRNSMDESVEILPMEEAVRAVDEVMRVHMMKADPDYPEFRYDPELFDRMKSFIRDGLAGVFKCRDDGGFVIYRFARYFPEGTYGNVYPGQSYYFRGTGVVVNPGWANYPYSCIDDGYSLFPLVNGEHECN